MATQLTHQRYGSSTMVALPFPEAVQKVKEALKEQGFGVLSEIDVRQALKDKLGVEHPPHLILGACNPQLAHQALNAEPDLGLLLPCNVTVREVDGRVQVAAIDAQQMLALVQNPALQPIAAEVNQRLQNALQSLT